MIQKAILFFISLLIAFIIGELAMRKFESNQQQWHVYQPSQKYIFEPDSSILFGISGQKEFTTNKKGYRSKNEFSSETKNWLCVGGSTTECTYLDDKETWYTIGEKSINSKSLDKYSFASIGRSGHTTNNHYAYIKKTIENDTEIDGIVLMCGINDFLKTLADTTKQFCINQYDSVLHLEKSGRINFGDWYAHSAFLFVIKTFFDNIFKNTEKAIDRNGKVIKKWRDHYASKVKLVDSLPNLSNAIMNYKKNLSSIIKLCQVNNIKIIVVNQAAIWGNDSCEYKLWMGGIGDYQNLQKSIYYSPSALRLGLTSFNLSTLDICNKNRVKIIDIDSALSLHHEYFYDDCHFNERGARELGLIILKRF
jgi:lysophospholipase L1-like esterase